MGLPGLEPGTSSLLEKRNNFLEVSKACKIPANIHIFLREDFPEPSGYSSGLLHGCCTQIALGIFQILRPADKKSVLVCLGAIDLSLLCQPQYLVRRSLPVLVSWGPGAGRPMRVEDE